MDQIQFNSSRMVLLTTTVARNHQVQPINTELSKLIRKQKLAPAPESAQDAEFTEVKAGEPLKHIDIYI
jgi:hypothetical protein